MILVTGNEGFIGSNFLKSCSEPTYCVPHWNFNLTDAPWDKITHVYHFGAISSTTETNVELLYRANIKFTLELFDYCKQYEIGITYASSASVYGNSSKHEINPLNYYAMSKATIDYKAKELIDNGINIVGLRFYNVYGAGEENKGNQASPVHQFTKQAVNDGVIKLFEDSSKYTRDFVWVGDVIECARTQKNPGIYDVGTSAPISFLDVAEQVAEKYGAYIQEIPFPEHLKGKYQLHTCALRDFDKEFISVKKYLTFCGS